MAGLCRIGHESTSCVWLPSVPKFSVCLTLYSQIVFAKGAHYALAQLSNSGYDVVGLDWTIRPEEARYNTYTMTSPMHIVEQSMTLFVWVNKVEGVEGIVYLRVWDKGALSGRRDVGSLKFLCVYRQAVGNRVSLQGNLDPCAIYSSKEEIAKSVEKLVLSFGRERWIANLGHGIYPDMDPDHLKMFIDSVHTLTQLK